MLKHHLTPLVALGLAITFTACGDDDAPPTTPVTASAVASETALVAGDITEEVALSLAAVSDTDTWARFGAAFDQLGGIAAFTGPDTTVPPVPGQPAPPPEEPVTTEDVEPGPTPEEISAEVRSFLEEKIFTEENLESSTPEGATFLIPGSAICDPITTCSGACDANGCTETCTDEIDQGCIDMIDTVEVRIGARPISPEGMNFSFFFGAAEHQPLTLELREGAIAAEVDLGATKATIELIEETSVSLGLNLDPDGLPQEPADLPEVLTGRLRLALEVTGEQAFEISASILEALDLQMQTPEGRISLQLAPTNPLIALAANGLLGTLGVDFDLADVDLTLPFGWMTDDPLSTGDLAMHLGGFSWSFDLDDAAQSVAFTNLGLGNTTTSLSKDGTQLLGIDLNAEVGRRFDLDITDYSAADRVEITVSPMFDLALSFGFATVADEFIDMPSFMLDETFGINLSGDTSASISPIPEDPITGEGGGIEVVTGTLEISSTAADAPVTVSAGQCLLGRADTDPRLDESHIILQLLEAATCP